MRLQFKFNRSLKRELAPGDRRLWLLRSVALRIERHTNPLWAFEVFHRRLLIAAGTLAVGGYLLAATALFLWLDRLPHNQVGWTDIAAPWRWAELRTRRGDTAVQAGLEALARREFSDAFYQLRVGLARSPGNVEGRLALVRLFAGHDPSRALALLEEGLTHAPGDEKLLATLFDFYSALQVHDRALETVDRLLAARPSGRAAFLLQRARVSLLLKLQRHADAGVALEALPLPSDPADAAGREVLNLQLLLQTGRLEDARRRVGDLLAGNETPPAVLRQCGEVAVALADADLVQSVLRRLRARDPESPGPYLYAVQAWHQMNRLTLREAAEQDYFHLFGANDGALQALAALAVGLDLPDLVNRARQVAASSRLSQFAYRVHLTEIALRRGDIGTAMRSLRDWEGGVETLAPPQRFYPEFIRRLARAAFAGTPDQTIHLLSHLGANRFQARLQTYDLAATVLEQAGHVPAADQVARAGLQVFPYSAPLLATSRRLEEGRTVLAKAAEGAAAPGPVPVLPASGEETMAALDMQLAADDLTAARDLLRSVRARQPAWQAAFEGEFAVRDVELAFLAFDGLTGRTAARTYLERHRSEADVLRVVRQGPSRPAGLRVRARHERHDLHPGQRRRRLLQQRQRRREQLEAAQRHDQHEPVLRRPDRPRLRQRRGSAVVGRRHAGQRQRHLGQLEDEPHRHRTVGGRRRVLHVL